MKIVITYSLKYSFWRRRIYGFTILSFDETFKLENFDGYGLKTYIWKEFLHNMVGWSSNRFDYRIISITRL